MKRTAPSLASHTAKGTPVPNRALKSTLRRTTQRVHRITQLAQFIQTLGCVHAVFSTYQVLTLSGPKVALYYAKPLPYKAIRALCALYDVKAPLASELQAPSFSISVAIPIHTGLLRYETKNGRVFTLTFANTA